MSSFFSLIKVQLLNTLRLNKLFKANPSKKRKSLLGLSLVMLFLAGLIGGMGYVYAWAYATTGLVSVVQVVALMCSLSALACLVFSFYSAGNVLYGAKDFDFLLSLPIKKSKIVISKLVFSYGIDLLFAILLVAPSLIVYADFGGIITLGIIARIIILLIFLPVVPIVISIVLSALFLFVSSRFKHSNIIQISLFVVVFLVYMLAMVGTAGVGNDVNMQLAEAYFLNGLIESAFISWQGALIYTGINLAVAGLVLYLVVITYVGINTAIKSKKTTSNFKLATYKSSNITKALFKKEIKTLFAYPIYAMNTLIGPLMGVVLFAVLLIVERQVPEIKILGVFVLPLVYAFIFMMSPTTANCISMEGSSFWIIKTSPASVIKLFRAKLYTYYVFNLIPTVVSLPVSIYLIWGIGVEYYILLAVMAISATMLAGNVGLIANLLFPLLKWETPNRPVKQGGSTLLTVICSFALCALLAVIFFVWEHPNLLVKYILVASFLVILTALTFIIIAKKGEKWLNEKIQL